MTFKSSSTFTHRQPDKIGVLLVNLGTPDAPTASALRPYLREFLSDPRVVEIPKAIWSIILHGIIVPFRSPKSAKAYKSIWTEEGSPLMAISVRQCDAIAKQLKNELGDQVVVELAMRYNKPSIPEKLQSLQDQGARKLVVLPLYPQYAASTVGSVFDAISADFQKRRWIPSMRFISHYHRDDGYITAMAKRIQEKWDIDGKRHLVMSFHGIPKRSLDLGDPYYCECQVTAKLLAKALKLEDDEYTVTFQSRFGKAEWLQPYTEPTLLAMPDRGIKSVDVFCPGFSADCLETLEEICEIEHGFLAAGGESFSYIEALNDQTEHIDALCDIILREVGDWNNDLVNLNARESRAKALGAKQ